MSDTSGPHLFSPLTLRGITTRNRVVVSPMCQYVAEEGVLTEWHYQHHVRFSAGGAGIAFVEATHVTRDGRITRGCSGLWNDAQIPPLQRIARLYEDAGVVPAIQLAHAGRKGSTARPWDGAGPLTGDEPEGEGPWTTVAPSAEPVKEGWHVPHALTGVEIEEIKDAWRQATRRALTAGFKIVEIHGAHGYLIHSFLSPRANHRDDDYGGDLEKRMRFALEIAAITREEWPDDYPVFYRSSAIDGVDGGWTLDDTVVLARELMARGVDLMDCSSGGIHGTTTLGKGHPGAGFQVPFAERVRRETAMPTMAVGFITEAGQADAIIREGRADLVALAREHLANPIWAYQASLKLGVERPHDVLPDSYGWYLDRRDALVKQGKDGS